MTKDVLVSISGLQIEAGEGGLENEPIEVVTPANYFFKNGKHYILYDEVTEGVSGVTKNKIKLSEDALEIMKTGVVNMHMIFERNKKNMTYYETPYGQMLIGIHTTKLNAKSGEDHLEVRVEYELDVNHEPLADCKIYMNIKPKSQGADVMKSPIMQ